MNNEENSLPVEPEFQTSEAFDVIAAAHTPKKNPFIPDIYDFAFALAVFVLGYLFSRWVFFAGIGWGVAAFTTAYLLAVYTYIIKKGGKPFSPSALFWAAVTWLTGASYTLWDGIGLEPVRMLFLFCAAVYFALVASGRTLMGNTGNFLLLDGLNAVLFIPFRNILNQYLSFTALRRNESGSVKKRLPVLLGILIALFLVVWLIPLLMQADSGGFTRIVTSITDMFRIDSSEVVEFLFYAAFTIPVSAYIYGLVSGVAHNRSTATITPESANKAVAALRFLQPATVNIVLGAVCVLYIIFIACQIPYFFSAFTGNRPDGWLVYAEYARRGFFELCSIAAINLAAITAGNVTSVKRRTESGALKVFNIALALVTLLLIATALSKMALYIGVYGLSILRLLPCVFMLFLAAVFVALIVLQYRAFSIVRFALVTGSVMLCALCVSNPDAIVVRYNTDRYLSGTLADYDTDVLYRAGAAGVLPALEVYESTQEEQLRLELASYLSVLKQECDFYRNSHKQSYERYRAGVRLNEAGIGTVS